MWELDPISVGLMLRQGRERNGHVSSRDDYDVVRGDRVVGRIFRSPTAPPDRPWMWMVTDESLKAGLPDHGFAASRHAAKNAFADTWRRGLARSSG
jgi:hypothetical protein